MTAADEWLTVESLDLEAQGVAHDNGGKVVFIEGALPGEQVQVRTGRSKNAWEQGEMTALRRESAQRVRPGERAESRVEPSEGLASAAGLGVQPRRARRGGRRERGRSWRS